uniref:FBD domain-containing protein n=1 Tax=Aegilops tauschii subsp. strangulata TaxID=200361 RepID=A0A453RYY5_AEGTS
FHQVVFTNLTTLSLNEWCLHNSCKALLYVLRHSPNLEKLTLGLSEVWISEFPRTLMGTLVHESSVIVFGCYLQVGALIYRRP